MSVAQQATHTRGIIAALEAIGGFAVGDASGEKLSHPYAVVYDISDSSSGSLANPHENSEFVYQVTCVGRGPDEARWLRDKVMGLLDGFSVSGRSIVLVTKEDGSGGIRRESEQVLVNGKPTWLYYCTPRFRVLSVPA